MRGKPWSVARGARSSRALFTGLLLAFALWAPASAGAAIGPKLVEFGEVGSDAGQISTPQGIAADPDTGHVFIADTSNDRISEFTAWGEFVKAWGWGVEDGSAELQTCTSTCQEGLGGAGPGQGVGQLIRPGGIAVAENGDVYVFEQVNRRVQVFSPAGDFLRMFGGGVDHTTGADVCTAADVAGGDECGAGSEGTGPSEFSMPASPATWRDYLDIDSGTVYVGDRDRIQEFEPDGTYKTSVSLPSPGDPSGLSVDPASGDLYFAYAGTGPEPGKAVRLSPSGALVYELPEKETGEEGAWAPTALAADPDGNVHLTQAGVTKVPPRILEIDPTGEIADVCCSLPVQGDPDSGVIPAVTTNVVTAAGGVDLYILYNRQNETYVEVRGPGPDKWLPPEVPPEIVGQFAAAVGQDSASIKAEINPKFWDDTHYYLEYGTAECRLGGCTKTPVPPGSLLSSGIVSVPVISEAIELSGLAENTTYHFRFVAASGGGGPVYGEDPDGSGPEEASFEDGRERTFTTYAPEPEPTVCPANQAFRTGPGAKLPDCRAYEMVSPLEKFGGDVLVQLNTLNLPAKLEQAAPDGDKLTYTSYRAFADPAGAPYQSQYLATRTAGGWATANISPPKEGPPFPGTPSLDVLYKGFLPDLSAGWLRQISEPVLAPGGVPGYPNIYR
ncbi:MAG TPA: NHL repeat-containing protein, partial [Solirubrobacterales bacterium]|nr:NHL repeat-containing protein [Solirubrobacterales bacterium]